MDMAADDAVDAAAPGFVRHRMLEAFDVFHGRAHPGLEERRQRCRPQAEQPANVVDGGIGGEQEVVEMIAEPGEPGAAFHDTVEFVTVHEPEAAAAAAV